jgi:hypothetical protein
MINRLGSPMLQEEDTKALIIMTTLFRNCNFQYI